VVSLTHGEDVYCVVTAGKYIFSYCVNPRLRLLA